MANRKEQVITKRHKPNTALRQVRNTLGLSQAEFAKLLRVSTPYVQAIEIGQRAASVEFAEKVREHTGAWPRCIVENWSNAVDAAGNPYSSQSAERPTWQVSKDAVIDAWRRFSGPLPVLLQGASAAGKSMVALSLVRDKLHEAVTKILALEGVTEAVEKELLELGRLAIDKHQRVHLAKMLAEGTKEARSEIASVNQRYLLGYYDTVEDLLRDLVPPGAPEQTSLAPRRTAKSLRTVPRLKIGKHGGSDAK